MSSPSLGFGVIEGFYGRPWSHDARLSMLRALADLGLDTYLYAPKNDPRHRASWWKPLDREEGRRLHELFALAEELGVSVVYGLAPERILGGSGNVRGRSFFRRDADHDGLADAPFERLRERISEISAIGARRFTLAFDDTWATFLPAMATFERGLLHARVAHRALAVARETAPLAEMFLVPAIYHRRIEDMPSGALAYFRGLATLGAEIPIAWTGPNIFSRRIDPSDVARLSRATGLDVWVWNNAIANDWLPLATGEPVGLRPQEKLSFGPPENLVHGVAAVAHGVLLNGAREPELTKVSLACLGEIAREGLRYDARAAHKRAIERSFGERGAVAARALYDLTKNHPLSAPGRFEGARLHDCARDFLEGRASLDALDAAVSEVSAISAALASAIGGSPLWAEVAPTLRRVALAVQAYRLTVERARAFRDRDEPLTKALSQSLAMVLEESKLARWQVGVEPLFHLAATSPAKIAARLPVG